MDQEKIIGIIESRASDEYVAAKNCVTDGNTKGAIVHYAVYAELVKLRDRIKAG